MHFIFELAQINFYLEFRKIDLKLLFEFEFCPPCLIIPISVLQPLTSPGRPCDCPQLSTHDYRGLFVSTEDPKGNKYTHKLPPTDITFHYPTHNSNDVCMEDQIIPMHKIFIKMQEEQSNYHKTLFLARDSLMNNSV